MFGEMHSCSSAGNDPLQASALAAAGYFVIAPDMPGYGQSDKPGDVAAYSLRRVCRLLCGLLDALGVRQACVVGHDWGAGTAWALAMHHPERVSKLVVLSVGHPGEAVPDAVQAHSRAGCSFHSLYPSTAAAVNCTAAAAHG